MSFRDVTLLKLVGFKPIIVHGGGKEISKWVDKDRHGTSFCKRAACNRCGRQWKLQKWYLEKSENSWYHMVEELGVKAVSISGKDGVMLKCREEIIPEERISDL